MLFCETLASDCQSSQHDQFCVLWADLVEIWDTVLDILGQTLLNLDVKWCGDIHN